MEASAAAATPTCITSLTLNDTTTQEYEPLKSGTHIVDEGGEVGVVVKLNENDADVHAIMTGTLPKHVIIQSPENHLYLSLVDPDYVAVPQAVRYVGDYSFGLVTRFEVVPATTGTGLVHIRSMLNNKYWTTWGTGNSWIIAAAAKPEENQSDQHCTLFQPFFLYSNNNHSVRLRHVHTGIFVKFFNDPSGPAHGLLGLRTGEEKYDVFTFIEWQSVVVFPNRIRIKNRENGNHLNARTDRYLDFRKIADNSSMFDFDVIPSRNGGIRLKSVPFGTYWTEENNTYILIQQASPTVHNTNTVFLPIRLDSERIVFRCLRSNFICRNYSSGASSWRDLLAARAAFPDNSSYLQIEEPVYSRTINNVRYRLSDARIYGENVIALISQSSTNRTQEPNSKTLDLRYLESRTSTWHASVSFTYGVTATASFGVPILMQGTVEVSWEFNAQYQWGETVTTEIDVGSSYTANVPAMSRVSVTLMATQGSYDVPFSYTQRDVLSNGTIQTYEKDDGLFTGRNGYNYEYKTEQFDL